MQIDSSKNIVAKFIWLSLGIIFLIIGLIGLILPVLPGFLFLIPAAFCFAKASSKFHAFIKRNKLIGKYF
ncbi:MAG: DUF454 family protein [Ignavibacteriaceae bacterium]